MFPVPRIVLFVTLYNAAHNPQYGQTCCGIPPHAGHLVLILHARNRATALLFKGFQFAAETFGGFLCLAYLHAWGDSDSSSMKCDTCKGLGTEMSHGAPCKHRCQCHAYAVLAYMLCLQYFDEGEGKQTAVQMLCDDCTRLRMQARPTSTPTQMPHSSWGAWSHACTAGMVIARGLSSLI